MLIPRKFMMYSDAKVFNCIFFFKRLWKKRERKKINKLFTGLGSVRIVKNCDLGPENAALGLRPRAAFSRPRSQFFTIRTSQPANNIYISTDQPLSALPEKFENAALFLRLGLPSTLIRHENAAFR